MYLQVFAFVLQTFFHWIVTGEYGLRYVAAVCFPHRVYFINIVLCDIAGLAFDKDQFLLVVQ